MQFHTNTSTMTDEQITATFNAAWAMLEQSNDYAPELTHAAVYNYWNEERKCCEAWLTDGNTSMNEAIKYELLCSLKPQ